MALHLPAWATDCLKRAEPALAALRVPLGLYERQRGAMRLAALDRRAIEAGLYCGQSLADARALAPGLMVREIDHRLLVAMFADFADWLSWASPIVSVLTDESPYGDLILDIAGVGHLFGGEAAMLERVTGRLGPFGFTVNGAIADSVGAAWALAHFSPGAIVAGDPSAALAGLPVAALRLSEAQRDGLEQMGLKRVGQLYGRDRKGLQARFGDSLIRRLDQARGWREERVTPRLPVAEHCAEHRFAEPIGLVDDVLAVTRDLAVRLCARLEREGLGAQSFHLLLYRIDHRLIRLSVNAARATRDAAHVARLFSNRAERLGGEYDAGFGIDMMRLAAGSLSRLDSHQAGAFEMQDGIADLDRLYDRMASRLGPMAVLRIKPVDTHIPERSVVLEPVIARTPDEAPTPPAPVAGRPLRLLPVPEPVEVPMAEVPDGPPPGMVWRRVDYRFARASGPERIGVEWWTVPERPDAAGAGDAALTRDYFIAEDDGGRRFWLFREGLYRKGVRPRWFLHGFFA